MTKIAALLTVHNRKNKTLECLRRLSEQHMPEGCTLDIFMTDDGCTDGTSEAVATQFPQVNIIRGDGNLFWNRGMFRAWEAAAVNFDYDYYLWLNDDTILLQDALMSLIEEASERPGSVIVGSTHSSVDPDKLTYGGYFAGRHILPNGYLQKCQTFNGNIVLVSREVYRRIGNLDWTYEHAIGDLDYGWMVTRAGLHNYVSREFRGICDKNPYPAKWVCPDVPFKERWRNYHSPLGYCQPGQLFHFNRKNFGLFKAIKVYTSNHLRLFFPWVWIGSQTKHCSI